MKSNGELQKAAKLTTSVILAGGRGSRLMGLTDNQAKPAVPFGGDFRIIDFTLSNCFNSGFRRINVLTQYQSQSLNDYVRGWDFMDPDKDEFINVLSSRAETGYLGTADAVYQNIGILNAYNAEWVLVLAGDHIYKMDYSAMLADHIQKGADLTIPCVEVPRLHATAFGVMAVDRHDRVVGFLEKPADPPGIPDNPAYALASMGIYIFNKKFLFDELRRDAQDGDSGHDFGKDLIPYLVSRARVFAHRFSDSCVRDRGQEAYWRDVGTVDAYWSANMDMTRPDCPLYAYPDQWPVYTEREDLPPSRFESGRPEGDSIVAPGCIVSNAVINHSLLSRRVTVDDNCIITDTVLLPGARVGKGSSLKNAVVDSECTIPAGLIVGEDPDEDARRFYRTGNGIVLINNQMLAGLN